MSEEKKTGIKGDTIVETPSGSIAASGISIGDEVKCLDGSFHPVVAIEQVASTSSITLSSKSENVLCCLPEQKVIHTLTPDKMGIFDFTEAKRAAGGFWLDTESSSWDYINSISGRNKDETDMFYIIQVEGNSPFIANGIVIASS